MMYAVLCFLPEEHELMPRSQEDEAEALERLDGVAAAFGGVAYAASLLPTTCAVSVRSGSSGPFTVDGSFIEAKEHLVGFYVLDCQTLEAAIAFAEQLVAAAPWSSGYEIRPVGAFKPSP